MNTPIAVVVWFLLWFLGTAFLPNLLSLPARIAWMLRVLLWAVGLLVCGVALWWRFHKQERASSSPGQIDAQWQDLDFLLQEAKKRFRKSSFGRRAKFESTAFFFVIGASKAGKTTSILNSGLDPELLSGLARQSADVVPTRTLNVWLSSSTILVEPAGDIWSDDAAWQRFVRQFRPSTAPAASSKLGTRAVLLCVSAEDLVRANGMGALIASGQLANTRINELAAELGVHLPVYVAVTKTNRLNYFEEFCSKFDDAEVQDVFGATLAMDTSENSAFLAFQTNRINNAFDNLVLSLDQRRTLLLDRENNPEKLAAIYQFPREFGKLRESIVPFLAELSKPRQIGISSYLRGFYFTGLRPVNAVDATGQSRRVPQFVFVNHLFRSLLTGDQHALAPSATSQRTAFFQRLFAFSAMLMAGATIFAATLCYVSNRALQRKATESILATRDTRAGAPIDCSIATTEALQKLDNIREVLSEVETRRSQPGFALRLPLYHSDQLYSSLRAAYFDRFRKILLDGPQVALLEYFNHLPEKPGVNQDYSYPYNALRTYLITTSHPEKSRSESLSPILLKFWQGSCPVSPTALDLAVRQFDFYAGELQATDTIDRPEDRVPVAHARRLLQGLTGFDRVYGAILADANNKVHSIQFNREYPGSDASVLNSKEIPGAFTKDGWKVVQNGLAHAKSLFEGESWVLGPDASQHVDFTGLEQQLRQRYQADYVSEWKQYLNQTRVLGYAGLPDASKKLALLSSPRSPLLAALYLVAKNTNLDNADFGSNLQPVQKVVDPKAENYNWIGGSNGPYVKALLKLQVPVEQLSNIPASKRDADPTAGTAQNAAASAKLAVRALAQQFRPDPVDKTDQTVVHLLEAPIVSVELLIRNANLSAVNARGGQLCSEMRKVIDKYPFNPKREKASLADLSNFFRRPDGLLWQFYAANLTTLLGEHKGIFSPKPNAPMAVRPLFVRSFNNMAAVSTYLTRGGTIRFPFSVQEFQGGGLKTIKLLIGGQGGTISSAPRQFSWPGDPNRGVEWTLGDSPTFPQEYPGFWGVFDWFNSATWESKSLDSFIVTWSLTLGGKPLPGTDGQPLKARLEVHMPIPLFQNGYLHALSCSGDIVQPGS